MPRLLPLLLLIALPLFAQEEIPEVARSLMEEAQQARDAKRLNDAIDKYKRVINVAPDLASAYVDLGAIYYDQGKVAEAYKVLTAGIERAPNDRTLLANAAAAAQQLGKPDRSLAFVDRALERNKRDDALYALRATALRALHRDDEALAALDQAVQLAPPEARHHFSRGNLLYQLGRKSDAIESFKKATELDPQLLRAHYNLGAVLFDVGRYDEALYEYKVALDPIDKSFAKNEKVDPIHAAAYANLGAIHIRKQQWSQAADAYAKALRLAPADAAVHYNLGFIYFNQKKPERAEEEYRKALALDPALPLAYLHLAELAFVRGDAAKTAEILQQGMPRFDAETKPQATLLLGRALLARGDRAGAKEALRQSDDLTSTLLLARLVRQDHDYIGAAPLVERAQRLAPSSQAVTLEAALLARDSGDLAHERALLEQLDHPELRLELVSVLVKLNDPAAARKQLDAMPNLPAGAASLKTFLAAAAIAEEGRREDAVRLLQPLAPNPIARGDLGLLHWQMGNSTAAIPDLTAARTALPDWPEVAVALGEMQIATHDYEAAIESLSRCTANAPICTRAKQALAVALLSQAATDSRRARSLVERATALPLDDRTEAVALFLRGTSELAAGNESAARDALTKALNHGLPSAAASAARNDLAAIAAASEATQPDPAPLPTTTQPRPTVLVYLPDAAVENEKKLAEAMTSLVTQLAATAAVPLTPQFFRHADDARSFFAANRERVGMVIASPEFVDDLGRDLAARFAFTRGGSASQRRVVVVGAASPIQSLADLRGKTLSAIDLARDAGVERAAASVIRVPDDSAAVANVLFNRSDAAIVSEANPLVAQRGLRVVHTTAPVPLPVIAFAPMPERDRTSLDNTLRAMSSARGLFAPLQLSGLTSLEEPRRAEPKRIEAAIVPVAALGLALPAAPANVTLRIGGGIEKVAINEEMFGTP